MASATRRIAAGRAERRPNRAGRSPSDDGSESDREQRRASIVVFFILYSSLIPGARGGVGAYDPEMSVTPPSPPCAARHLSSIPSMCAIPTTATVRPGQSRSSRRVMISSRSSSMAAATRGNCARICLVSADVARLVLSSSTARSGLLQSRTRNDARARGPSTRVRFRRGSNRR